MPRRAWLPLLLVVLCQARPAAAIDRFWPQDRHDAQGTAHSANVSDIDQPAVRWRHFLGGSPDWVRSADVDLDGHTDVVKVEGGRVKALTTHGKVLWATDVFGIAGLLDPVDLDGDGLSEIVAYSSTRAYVLAATSGAVGWSSPLGAFVALSFVVAADQDGDGIAELWLADAGGWATPVSPCTYVYRFKGGPQLALQTDYPNPAVEWKHTMGQQLVDVDGDGKLDVFVPSYNRMAAFSGQTGKLIGQSAVNPLVGYAGDRVVSLPHPSGGAPLVAFASNWGSGTSGHRGVYVLRLLGGVLEPVWTYLVPDQVAGSYESPPGSIGDLDGDGEFEAIDGTFDAGAHTLMAQDLATGVTLSALDGSAPELGGAGGPSLLHVLRIGAGGPVRLLVAPAKVAAAPAFAELHLYAWSRTGGFEHVGLLGTGALTGASWQVFQTALASSGQALALLPLTGSAGATAHAVLVSDSNGDQAADTLSIHAVGATGASLVAEKAFSLPPKVIGWSGNGAGRNVLAATPDGAGLELDAALGLVNDGDGDGKPDLVFAAFSQPYAAVAPTGKDDDTPMVAVTRPGGFALLDPAQAGPVTPPKTLWSTQSAFMTRGAFADVDGDGSTDVLVRSVSTKGLPTLTAHEAKGDTKWTFGPTSGEWYWFWTLLTVLAPDANGAQNVLVSLVSGAGYAKDFPLLSVVDGKSGAALWDPTAACAFAQIQAGQDPVGGGLVLSGYYERYLCDPAIGAMTGKVTSTSSSFGYPMLVDVNADDKTDLFLSGCWASVMGEMGPDFKSGWSEVAADENDTSFATLTPSAAGHLHARTLAGSARLQVRLAATGAVVWTKGYVAGKAVDPETPEAKGFTLRGLISVADLTGKGHPNLIFISTQGYLYAVDATNGEVDWAMNWGGTLGDPIVADVDKDGKIEILVSSADGYLYAIDKQSSMPPAWVRENDGTGPAMNDAQDIDEQEDTAAVHVNWAPGAGAEGSMVTLQDQTGAAVAPPIFTTKDALTVGELYLQLDSVYTAKVQAYASVGQDSALSEPTLSDGIQIKDKSPPVIAGFEASPSGMPAGGAGTTFLGKLTDKTRLKRWTIVLVPDGGGPSVWTATAPLALAAVDLAAPWTATTTGGAPAPAGTYQATLTVEDVGGHSATAQAALVICKAEEIWDGLACTAAAAEVGEVVEDVEGGEDAGGEVEEADAGGQAEVMADAATPVEDAATPVEDAATPVEDAATPVEDAATPVEDAAEGSEWDAVDVVSDVMADTGADVAAMDGGASDAKAADAAGGAADSAAAADTATPADVLVPTDAATPAVSVDGEHAKGCACDVKGGASGPTAGDVAVLGLAGLALGLARARRRD